MKIKTIGFNGSVIGIVTNGETKRVPFHNIYPELDKLNERFGTGFMIIDPRFADKMLKTKWPQMIQYFPFATDALIAHEKPGVSLGRQIVSEQKPRYVLPTKRYEGATNAALVVIGLSSSDFMKDGKDIVLDIESKRMILIRDFPATGGRYRKHPETTIPHADAVEQAHDVHSRLSRMNAAYVGAIVRDSDAWTFRTSTLLCEGLSIVVTGSEEDFRNAGAPEPDDVVARLSSIPPPKSKPPPSLGRRIIDSIFPKE